MVTHTPVTHSRKAIFAVLSRTSFYLLVFIYLLFVLFPVVWIFLMSIKLPVDITAYPPKLFFEPTWQNYVKLFSSESNVGGQAFVHYLYNSIVICLASIAVAVVVGLPAAFSLGRFRYRGADSIAFTFLSFRFAPELTIILPLYIIFRHLGLYDTYLGMVWVYQLLILPLFIWMMRGFFSHIPEEIEDAALVEGASWWQVFWKVHFPLVKGGLAATVILCFIFAWNNFMFGLILGSQQTQPVTVGALGFMSYNEVNWGEMAAASMLIIVPELILALLVQRHLIRGLTFGATSEE